MTVEFLSKFEKDLDEISHKPTKQSLLVLIQKIEQASDFSQISNVKKLQGYKNAFRIRVRDYRVGVFVDGKIVQLARVKNRKDIYKFFP